MAGEIVGEVGERRLMGEIVGEIGERRLREEEGGGTSSTREGVVRTGISKVLSGWLMSLKYSKLG